ncbi:MAG: HAD-IC family P-type ATPase, partial [Mangrovicoccus sp.]
DKTGTLTEGKPRLVDSLDFAATAHEALAAAAALEAQSSHPLGRAILAAADMRGLTVPNTQEVSETPGRGMIGQINGENWLIGNAPFLEENGISTSQATDALEQMASIGQTPLLMGRNGALAAVFGLSDPMKSTTPDALAALKSQGLGLAMITGDRQATAQTVADRLGLDIVRAEVTPAGKSAEITALQAGGPVLFVGDGINDAPALAQADTGIAVGTGSDVAVETADVLLMGEDLSGVARAIALSRATMRNIKQNLGWAFGYNIALIPVAAGLLVPFGGPQLQPIFAASAMACSSVLVVSNALRLRFFTPGFDRAAKPSLVKTAETSLNPAE